MERRQPVRTQRTTRAALIAVGIVAGLVALQVVADAWWNDGANVAGPRPIAMLDAPDFHSLVVDPQDPNHLLFGSHSGIQESHDGGFSWQEGALRNTDAMSMAVSPQEPMTLYVAGHDVFQVSHDGGQSWQPVTHNLPGTDIHGFAQDPTAPDRLYAFVVGFGLFSSADGGTSWAPLQTQPPGSGMHLALASSGTALYAATESGVVTSQDQGATWQPLPAQPSGAVLSLAIPANAPQTIYAGTKGGLVKSTDGGQSWTGLMAPRVPVLALAVTPGDPQRVFLVSDKGSVYRSDDGGTSWESRR